MIKIEWDVLKPHVHLFDWIDEVPLQDPHGGEDIRKEDLKEEIDSASVTYFYLRLPHNIQLDGQSRVDNDPYSIRFDTSLTGRCVWIRPFIRHQVIDDRYDRLFDFIDIPKQRPFRLMIRATL